ncbi:MAG: bifunctional rhamnulose-1-phosphate aldolase/short-chain dehydrogenase [Candidatus Rokubacteria bacterium]|nr:bifunctional rhamnulose-1-phosphate aldolase/short-chain dehydrogenase [Candidatus Rokubacteria bacterium]
MNSRWDDAAARGLDDLDLLVYTSRLVGAETSLVVWGGGNTSIKRAERDHRGRAARVLRVKGSGSDLKSIQREHFPGVRLDDILALLEREDMGDQEMVDYLRFALQEPDGARPSIETLLHGFLPAEAVIHTHADAIVSLTNNTRAADVLRAIYGDEVAALPYRRPGFRISREVAELLQQRPGLRAILLEKHGTICWGATPKAAYLATVELISRAEEAIAQQARGRVRFGGVAVPAPATEERRAVALAAAPHLRGLVGRERRAIVLFDDAPDVLEFAASREAQALCNVGPATPDHTIYTKRLPCFVPVDRPADPEAVKAALGASVERFVADYTAYIRAHDREGAAALADPYPRVVVVAGLGMFTTGKDRRTAGIVSDIYHHTISVLGAASSFGPYVSLSAQDAFDVEYWPLELYKLAQAPPERELSRRVALVTGAAGAIGRAVALRLAAEGAHVVLADVDEAGARKAADDLRTAHGAGRALGLGLDVTSEASVRAAFEETVRAYGGLDIVVSNAGIAHSAPVDRMELGDWERSFAVNATGHFLVAREGMRLLEAQGLGGTFVFVATKNVMSPGKDFAAYSAAKAAEAQLAKVLALEGGPHGIRSNIVNPDAVFRESRLWSAEVRRERARAQGIAVDELEEFYRKRNILARPILPEDVAEAVLFLASDRSAKTTGCTLTVDGGVKDAFPR